jgi:hypothetical protein
LYSSPYNYSVRIKEDKTGGGEVCHVWRRREMVGILQERDHLGDKDVDGEDQIKMDLTSDLRLWTELMWLNTGTAVGSCVQGNELKDSAPYSNLLLQEPQILGNRQNYRKED